MRLAPYVPLAQKKRDARGRLIGGLRERQILAEYYASPEYKLWKVRGLRESVLGFVGMTPRQRLSQIWERLAELQEKAMGLRRALREDWAQFDDQRARDAFQRTGHGRGMYAVHHGKQNPVGHGMARVRGFADRDHAMAFQQAMHDQGHGAGWDAKGGKYFVSVLHSGVKAAEAAGNWERPGIEVEVLAECGIQSLRERMRPEYPTVGLSEEIAAGAVGAADLREAVAASSMTQLTRTRAVRGGRRMKDSEKGIGPSPFESLADDQTAINAKDPVVAKNLAAMAAARRQRAATGQALNLFATEAEHGSYPHDTDDLKIATKIGDPMALDVSDDQARAAALIDEAEMYMSEDHEDPEEIKDLIARIGDMLKGESDPDVRKALSTAAASLSRIVGEDEEEAGDHGSSAISTYAAEDGEEEVYNSEGEAWEDGDGPKFYMNAEGELEQVEDEEETHGGGTGSGVPEPPAPGERYGTLRQPAGQSIVGAIELEDGEVPRKPGSSPMPGRGGLKRYPGEPRVGMADESRRKKGAAAEVLESLRPFSNEYHTGVR